MIQIVKKNDDIIKFLQRDRCINHNALSYLTYNEDADVYIYDGDTENGVIIGTGGWSFFFLATHNRNFLEYFWKSLPIGHKMFSSVPATTFDIFAKGRNTVWQTPCEVYFYDGVSQIVQSRTNYTIEPLAITDAEEIDLYYTYRSEGSVNRLRESIRNLPSACIRIDGNLAAWCLLHSEDGSLGPLFTKPMFRGKGLAETVATNLMKQLVAKNMIPYVQIAKDNVPSLALIKQLGCMEYSHECIWFGLDKS